MSYDAWKANAPDPGTVEDEPCRACGAPEHEPCAVWCECDHCLKSRHSEPEAPTFDDALGSRCDAVDAERDAWELEHQ